MSPLIDDLLVMMPLFQNWEMCLNCSDFTESRTSFCKAYNQLISFSKWPQLFFSSVMKITRRWFEELLHMLDSLWLLAVCKKSLDWPLWKTWNLCTPPAWFCIVSWFCLGSISTEDKRHFKTREKIVIVTLHLGWMVIISNNLNFTVKKLQPRTLNWKITWRVFYDTEGWRNSLGILQLC